MDGRKPRMEGKKKERRKSWKKGRKVDYSGY